MPEQLGNYIQKEVSDGADENEVKDRLSNAGYVDEHIKEGVETIDKVEDHKVAQPAEPGHGKEIMIGIFVVIVIALLFILIANMKTDPDIDDPLDPTDPGNNVQTQLTEEEIMVLSSFDLTDGRTYTEVEAEIEELIETKKILEGNEVSESYDNYRRYKMIQLKMMILDAVDKKKIEKGDSFKETAYNYKNYLSEEDILRRNIDLAVKYGIIHEGNTYAETKKNYQAYLEERANRPTPFDEQKELTKEYVDCKAENDLKYTMCMAAAKRDFSLCDAYKDNAYGLMRCKFAFGYSEALFHNSNAGCSNFVGLDRERCLLAVSRDKSVCESQGSNRDLCIDYADSFVKLANGDVDECDISPLNHPIECKIIMLQSEEECLKFNDKDCPAKYK